MNTKATPFSFGGNATSAPSFTPSNTNTFNTNASSFTPGANQSVPQNLNSNAPTWQPSAPQQQQPPQMAAPQMYGQQQQPAMNTYQQQMQPNYNGYQQMQAPQSYNSFQPQQPQQPAYHQNQYQAPPPQQQQQPRQYNQGYNNQGYTNNYNSYNQGQQSYNNRPAFKPHHQQNYNDYSGSYQPKQPATQQKTMSTNVTSFNPSTKAFTPAASAPAFKPKTQNWDSFKDEGYNSGFQLQNTAYNTPMTAATTAAPAAPAQPAAGAVSFNLSATTFKPFTPQEIKKVDETKKALLELKVKEDDVPKYKAAIEMVKKNKVETDGEAPEPASSFAFPEVEGAINMDVFLKIAELPICQSQEASSDELKTLVKASILDREIVETVEQKKGGYRNDKYKQRPGQGGYNNDFAKGTARPNKPGGRHDFTSWKQEDTEEKQKLRKQAEIIKDKLKGEKNLPQKIKLLLNVITPDNHDKKFGELRGYLFPTQKSKAECEEEGIEYVPEEHLLTNDNLDMEVLNIVVQNLLKKANTEKEYQIFYGQLCNELIRLELQLRDLTNTLGNQKHSQFRTALIDVCREHFDTNTSAEERKKYEGDFEGMFKFQDRLFGNIMFVGELYRINLLKLSAISQILTDLMGTNTDGEYKKDSEIDDLKIEGSVNLMNKIGKALEENLAKTSGKKKADPKKNSAEVFANIFKTFEKLMGEEETRICNRVKLLIKNMFSNKESNWEKTKKKNEERPKTKAEVHNEMVKQYDDQQQASHHHQQQDDDGYYNTKGGYNQRDRKGERGGKGKYNEKQQYQVKQGKDGNSRGGRGGRKDRDEPRKQVEIVPIEDGKLGDFVKKNFDAYLASKRMGQEEIGDEEEKQEQPKKKEVDLSLYRKLERENGRSQDDILFHLITRCFFDCESSDLPELTPYLLLLTKEKNILKGGGLSDGFSSIIAKMGELALDSPKIPLYLHDYAMKPLWEANLLHLNKIQWGRDPPKEEDEDEDTMFWNSSELFRLAALTLQTVMTAKKVSVEKAAEELSSGKNSLTAALKDRAGKLEDEDGMWGDMDDELSGPDSEAIKAWLKKAMN